MNLVVDEPIPAGLLDRLDPPEAFVVADHENRRSVGESGLQHLGLLGTGAAVEHHDPQFRQPEANLLHPGRHHGLRAAAQNAADGVGDQPLADDLQGGARFPATHAHVQDDLTPAACPLDRLLLVYPEHALPPP